MKLGLAWQMQSAATCQIIRGGEVGAACRHHRGERRRIIAPRDVSLICDDPDLAFSWCLPVVSHFHWDTRTVVSRVVRWVENVAHGKEDRQQSFIKAEFVEGGTIGPVKGKSGG